MNSKRILTVILAVVISAPFIKAASLNVSVREIGFPFGLFEITIAVCAVLGHMIYQGRRKHRALD